MAAARDIIQEIRAKSSLTEELENEINKIQAGNVGIPPVEMDIDIPVKDGYGAWDKTYTNPFPINITVHATGSIKSPPNGTWRIRILANSDVVFDKSGITPNQEFQASVTVKGWSSKHVHVDAWWTEKANTTLKAHIKAKF